jgi:hypothetical protein
MLLAVSVNMVNARLLQGAAAGARVAVVIEYPSPILGLLEKRGFSACLIHAVIAFQVLTVNGTVGTP